MPRMLRILAAALLVLAPAHAGDRPGDPPFQGRSAVIAKNGMAATAHPLATAAAVEILKAGGSAADAAIAANAVLGLVEPTGNGIGGDLFALVWNPKTRAVEGLDASGFAPRGVDAAALAAASRTGTLPERGMDTVTIPGAVAGWEALHARHGKLPLDQVLAPAVRLAREGFPVSPVIARGWGASIRDFRRRAPELQAPEWIDRLYAPSGEAPKAGEIFTNPDLAETLEAIGRRGAAAFYRGAFAADFEAHFKAFGRPHAASDLAAMKAEWVAPISVPYRKVRLWQIPPATQGLTTLQMARIVERFPVRDLTEADRLHVLLEAKKLAFADRARFLADPRRSPVPVETLLSDRYIASRAALIRMDRALPDATPPGDPEGSHSDTTYLATGDASGMMVSLIQSNYSGMGSGIIVPRRTPVAGGRHTWGFMLQNRGAQFSLKPDSPNRIEGGKRPFHTIIPGMVTKGEAPLMAFGVMGGTMQPQGQVQILMNIVDLGLDPQAAGDAPRARHLGSPDPDGGTETPAGVFLESGFSAETRKSLEARGHSLLDRHQDVGGYQAVVWDAANRVWWGASEMRKDGLALGF
jgi:gamma-glutamyltranspeptidase/glutathione hydrolase